MSRFSNIRRQPVNAFVRRWLRMARHRAVAMAARRPASVHKIVTLSSLVGSARPSFGGHVRAAACRRIASGFVAIEDWQRAINWQARAVRLDPTTLRGWESLAHTYTCVGTVATSPESAEAATELYTHVI